MFFGLAYLPPYEVEDGFLDVIVSVPGNERVGDFLVYLSETFVGPKSRFPPRLWASSPEFSQPKTTNGAESFHRRVKNHFYAPHASVHLVVDVLKGVQAETYIKMREDSKGRGPRKHQRESDEKIMALWHQYSSGGISRLHYLRRVGQLKQAIDMTARN